MGDFAAFQETLRKLVRAFDENRVAMRTGEFDELSTRNEYLDPLFSALNWDVGNTHKVPIHEREVVVHPVAKTHLGLRRPDYIFRVGGIDKFICEAKRPFDNINRHYFQTQNYVYNFRLWVGVLCDFEHFIAFVVGGEPSRDVPFSPANGWRLHYLDYEAKAQAMWDLFARENVASGSLEVFAQSQPKVARKGKQGWLLKPDRTKTVDAKFLAYLEDQRARLARDLHDHNRRVWTERELNEATQRIIDRILFQRICEDRNIDVGQTLHAAHSKWDRRDRPRGGLWPTLVANFRHLHRSFNGGIFGRAGTPPHFVDDLHVSDIWLSEFIEELTADDSTYLFGIIPVEILGSVYERFLGSVVKPDGSVVQKPEVRKAGGVYYTPRYIVDYIVEKTVGQLVDKKSPREVARIKVLDPACGSGSFLLRAFERICEHHVNWYTSHPEDRQKQTCYLDSNGDVRLTTGFKRTILINNIFGVDIDPQAVEVTQMSLYLKVLEGETTQTLESDHRLFPAQTYLPDLDNNIKCGNSLIDFDAFSAMDADHETFEIVNPFNWKNEFKDVMKAGGFHAVIGNPPYLNIDDTWGAGDPRLKCIKSSFSEIYNDKTDILFYFFKRGADLSRSHIGFIVSRAFLEAFKADKLREWLAKHTSIREIVDFRNRYIFEGIGITTAIVHLNKARVTREAKVLQLIEPNAELSPLQERIDDGAAFSSLEVPQKKFGKQSWIFAGKEVERLIQKIDHAGEPIGEVLAIGQGMQTGRNNVFGDLPDSIITEWNLGEGDYYERARNSDIQRYEVLHSGEILLYLENYASFLDLPDPIQKHLKRHETELKKRAAFKRGNCKWWQYTWPLHKEMYSRRRIYCPYLATSNRFALDSQRRFLGLTDTTVLFDNQQEEELEYFVSLLNSRLLTWRFRYIGKLKSGGIYEYFWNSVSKLRIHRFKKSHATRTKLVNLSSQVANLTKRVSASRSDADRTALRRAIKQAEDTINSLVYTLYGLTAAEIELVERELPSK